jgi:hypothetical protein
MTTRSTSGWRRAKRSSHAVTSTPPFSRIAVDVHAAPSLNGVGLDRVTESLNCDNDGESPGQYSLAVNQNWLMYACEDPNVLFVSHNRTDHQEAVEKLPGGYGLLLWP